MIRRLQTFLFTDVKALQAFHILRQGAAILIAILLTKTSLGTERIGGYEMLLYLGALVSACWVQGLVQGLLSEYPRLSAPDQRSFITNAYGLFLVLGMLISGVMIAGQPWLLPWLTGQEELPYYTLFFIYLGLNFPPFLLENFFLLWQQPRMNFLFGLLSFLPQIAVVVLPPWMGWDFVYSFYGLIAWALVRHGWLAYQVLIRGELNYRPDLLRRWWMLSLPLVLYSLLGIINVSFSSWLVSWYYQGDETIFAIFRYGAREVPLMLAMTGALGTAMVPLIAGQLTNGLAQLRRKSRQLFHVLFPLSIGLMLSSKWIFPWLFNEAFSESVVIFNIFLLVVISRLIFSRTVLVGLQDNRVILLISILELIVNVGLSWWLVHQLGLVGIAWGAVAAITFEKILIAGYVYYRYGIGLSKYTDLRWLIGYSLLLLFAFWWEMSA